MSDAVSWPSERSVDARAHFATLLARSLERDDLAPHLQKRVVNALTLAVDDPSPRVRLALAEAIAGNVRAPIHIVAQLASDRPDIAGLVIARSPVLTDRDVPELAERLDARLLPVLAARVESDASAQALIVHGCQITAVALLNNPTVALSRRTLETIADAFGEHAEVRALLLSREDLPIGARYALVERLCTVLSASGLVTNILGDARGRSILNDAQGGALIAASNGRTRSEVDALVAQLTDRAAIDPEALLRALVFSERDLFASLICRLGGIGPRRVRSLLRGGRVAVVRGMLDRCGVPKPAAEFLANVNALVQAQAESPERMMRRVIGSIEPTCQTTTALLSAVRRWQRDLVRQPLSAAA